MIDWPKIRCWCEEDIPPWACFFIRDILNPSALEEPVAIVFRPLADLDHDFNADVLTKTWDPDALYYTGGLYVSNLRPECLTNGPVSVPAKSIFHATQVMRGPHWMGYGDDANSDHFWFHPRTDSWLLGSIADPRTEVDNRLRGVIFRRIGAADRVQKCVPVLMVSSDE